MNTLVVVLIHCVCLLTIASGMSWMQSANPCTQQQQAAAGAPPGAYVPECTSTGWFKPQQCDYSTGNCWCVNPETGAELSWTRMRTSGVVACPKCFLDQADQLPAPGTAGASPPECDDNGYFKVKQSSGSSGYSWCVDPTSGTEIPGSKVGPGSSPPCV